MNDFTWSFPCPFPFLGLMAEKAASWGFEHLEVLGPNYTPFPHYHKVCARSWAWLPTQSLTLRPSCLRTLEGRGWVEKWWYDSIALPFLAQPLRTQIYKESHLFLFHSHPQQRECPASLLVGHTWLNSPKVRRRAVTLSSLWKKGPRYAGRQRDAAGDLSPH